VHFAHSECPRNRPRPFDGCRRDLRRHPAIPHRFNEAPALRRLGACLTDRRRGQDAVERAVCTDEGALVIEEVEVGGGGLRG